MKKTTPPLLPLLSKTFFLFSGVMFVAFWNLVLNFSFYFNLIISPDFSVYMTFTLMIGVNLSFLTSRFLFKRVRGDKLIFFSLMTSCLALTFFVIFIEISNSTNFKQVATIFLVFVAGFFGGIFQGKISGLAASMGSRAITLMNSGTGVCGFGSNLVSMLFFVIFPTTEKDKEMDAYRNQLVFYLVLVNVILGGYLVILYKFLKGNHEKVRALDYTLSNQKIALTEKKKLLETNQTPAIPLLEEPEHPVQSVWTRIVDLWMGMIFNYSLSLQVICFFIPKLTEIYDNNSQIMLLVYFFVFNLVDTMAKLTPPRFFIKNSQIVHLLSIVRLAFQVFFALILLTSNPPKAITHPMMRIFVYFLLASLDGYFTNNYFCLAADRFRNKKNKDKSGYLMIFALDAGVLMGTFLGVLWTL